MRGVIATYGTMGDVQPLLALGAELSRRGHSLKFAAPPDFADRAHRLGFGFVPLGPPMDPVELREVYGHSVLTRDVVQHVKRTLPLVIRDTPRMVEELASACADADILMSLPYQLAGRIVHDLHHVPLISIHLSPFGGYSRRFVAESSLLINELRACYGLNPLDDPLGPSGSSSLLTLYAVSPTLCLRPRHWPEHHRMTGFFFLDEKWAPDPALERFVNAGEPPIVVSFGSVLHQSPEALARIVLEAITGVHRRAVIQRGWTGLEFQSIPHEIHVTGTVPHHWLFPRAACVVHAGGAGTTAAALRAGIPSVIVPHVLDQFLWATLAKERGCASDVIPFVELNAERLQRAIEKALLPESRSAAGKLGENISRENGISIAADLIESYGQQSQRSGALTPAFET